MYLVAIAWIYVVLMMVVAEITSPIGTVLGAFMTLLLYGLLPLSIVLYLMGTPARRRRIKQLEAQAQASSAVNPDAGSQPAGDAVAPERKEP